VELEWVPKEEFIEELEKISDPNVPLKELEISDERYLRALMRSIKIEGFRDPILIEVRSNGTKMIYDGHHRLIALKKLGRKKAPVVEGSWDELQPYIDKQYNLWDRRL
jgi:ParB-like chromosome segregation protein Spo0J